MRLKELRMQRKLRQQDVADAINCSQAVYSRYENGDREPSQDTLNRLADFFGVSIDYLLGRDQPQTVTDTGADTGDGVEFRFLARGMKPMTPERQQKAIELLRLLLEEDDDGLDQAARVIHALKNKP